MWLFELVIYVALVDPGPRFLLLMIPYYPLMDGYNYSREIQKYASVSALCASSPSHSFPINSHLLSDDLYQYFVDHGVFPAVDVHLNCRW